ncbi:unnamed protein product [Oncorhynchus mykiss]|uniref:Histone-lysine N-methyltransferase 2C n=1 Tax=Oncorhynchus mykiss TaxID=8022 RepID=A0A060WFI0_ONCMY|nr:unnamed protein product [Oncorhynchus mykiss]
MCSLCFLYFIDRVFVWYAFFGKGLLDKSKQSRQAGLLTTGLCEELLDKCKQSSQAGLVTTGLCEESPGAHAETKPPSASFLDPLSDPLLSATSTTTPISSKAGLPDTEDPLVDLSEVLSTDADLLGMLSDDLVKSGHNSGLDLCPFQVDCSSSPFAGLDMDPIPDDPTGLCQGSAGRGPRALQEEPLDVILSPELDKMVADVKPLASPLPLCAHSVSLVKSRGFSSAILSKLYKIPELEGKDVEDLFTAVLSPSTSQPPQLRHPQPAHPGPNVPRAVAIPNPGDHGMFPRMPMINGMMGPNPHFPPTPMMPGSTGPCGLGNFSPIHRMPFPDKIRDKKFSQMGGDVVGSWSAPVPGPVPPPEGETDTMSNAQRSTLKWEKEETLGEMATVAPVLYTNVNFPNLLEEFPDWAMRVKQIAKLWRKASSQDRAPYVQKARDNRAALRINKVQMSNDTLKRHQHPQQQQQLLTDTFDPNSVPLDTELLFKDSLKPKESEHEQEWKFRQGELNQMWGPLKKQQEKVPKSKAIKSTNKDVLFGHSNQATIAAGGGKNSLQMRQKSKQQAKIEATQKLEQVKNEQLQQQQQQQQQLFSSQAGGDTTPNSGNQSPMTPQPSNGGKSGNSSPLQPIVSKDGFARPQLPGTPTSGSQDDSPHMFSPDSSSGSRPSSPWDPYAKMVGTPRPPPGGGGSTTPRQNSLSEMQERGGRPSGNADPYAKMPDTPRPPDPFVKPMGPARQQQHQQVRHNMMSPPSGGETFARMGGHRAESGSVSVFKAPMPPQQSQQEPYGGPMPGGLKRGPSDGFPQGIQADPYAQQPLTPRPLMGEGHPHRNPYAQAPSTPRPDYSQQILRLDQFPQQHPPNHRPSPSHSMDPYASMPGTPRPAPGDRFPKSPGSQRNMDPYAQQPGTPRPLLADPYAQAPGTPRPEAGPDAFNRLCSRPTPMSQLPADPFSHQSPGRVQDGFACPSAQGSQTAKHPGMSDESFSLPQSNHHGGQTQIHDPFELGPMTPYAQTSERQAHDIPQSSRNTVDTQNSMLPHLGDTEEKLRQRQRLRQQILRQQQQKSAIRQEKGLLQETVAAPNPGTPRHWSHDDPAPQNDMFGRPPPPYPGPMRGGQRFPGTFLGDQRGHFPNEGQFARPHFPRDMGMRPQEMRFGFPPSPQGSLQPGQEQHFLRALHQMPGGPMVDNVPPQMRMSHSVDFSRGVMGGNTQMGLPQPFPQQGLPVQQHNIMGQPFIELRHRAPQNRMRMPFGHGPPNVMDPSNQPQIPPQGFMEGQEMGFAGNQLSRMMDPMMDSPSQGSVGHTHMSASMENLHQQQTEVPMTMGQQQHPSLNRSLSHPVTGEPLNVAPSSMLLPGSSTDLVDLNLNLDPDDGKDLELGPNDLHLDDFLMSGKFDLIAYTDPELNLDDKKDMFSEEDLDLGDPMEDHQQDMFKTEDTIKTEVKDEHVQNQDQSLCSGPRNDNRTMTNQEDAGLYEQPGQTDSGSTPVLSCLLIKEKLENIGLNPSVAMGHRVSPTLVQSRLSMGNHSFGASANQQVELNLAMQQGPSLGQAGPQNRPLLLEEQPLLLQDLLDQERHEQQQQRQMQAMIRQRSSDSFFPNMADFDAITDPIMKAKMVALKGINKVMAQNSMGMPPIVINRIQQTPGAHGPDAAAALPQHVLGQDGKLAPQMARPNPPNFGPGFVNDSQRKQYEEWLQETQQLLQMQQKFLEDQIGAHRKSKKALSAKQRTAKKAGREFPEEDVEQLKHVTEQQSVVQKQLEQIRKQQKDHAELIEEYRVKQQQQRPSPPMGQPMMGPMMPMQPHPSQHNPACIPNMPGWHPGGAQGLMGGPAQLPPQPPPSMVPGTKATPTGNGAGAQGANGGSGGNSLAVKFDDNNPFSEGFQERERRDRLREQQERQRVQLMQEVERHRAMQQRLEMEQQGLGDSLAHMPFYSTDLPQDFMQPSRPQQQQGQLGPITGGPLPGQGFMPDGERRSMPGNRAFGSPEMDRGMMPQVGGEGHGPPFGMDSSTPLPPNYPGSGQSLIQLYSNIIPEEKAKKKRNRKKKRDSVDDADSVKTPSTPHSDLCAPLTPSHLSDTSSTPTRSLSIPGEQDLGAVAANEGSALWHGPRAGGIVKEEEGSEGGLSSPLHGAKGGDAGNELLKHLLKNKSTPPPGASANQAPPTQQMSCNSLSSEQQASADLKATARPASTTNNMTPPHSQLTGSTELLEPSVPAQGKRKQQRNKRTPKNGAEKPPSRYKRRKKEEEERQIGYSSTDSLTQLKRQLSLLPLMEPLMGVNFSHFPPFGSGQVNGENRLSGSFGSASLDGVSDYYSQLIYKQNNLSNPPTPPASLPPTPPPMARQKMVNGFATAEDLARKTAVLGSHDVIKGLGAKQLPTAFRTEEDLMTHDITQGPKTVDVPASLPTPPHNNQEELRGQDHCVDRDTPDSFVPSSSPESVVGMEISRYPDLSKVKEEPTSPCSSPVIPMLPSASGKGTEIKQEVKTEPSSSFFGSQFGQPPSCAKAGLVSIEITLNPVSAENVPGVVAAVADLLCVTIPSSYEVSRSPERSSLALLAGLKVPQTQGMDPLHVSMFPQHQQPPTIRSLRPPGSPNHPRISQPFQPIGPPTSAGSAARGEGPKPQWCCHCKVVVLGNGVRKSTKDLACSKRERPNQVFCSRNCFVLHTAATQSKATDSKPNTSPLLPESSVKENPSKVLHQYSNNMSTLDSAPSSPPPISFPTEKPKPDTLKVTVKLKPRPRAVHSASGGGDDMSPRHHKRWKGLRWRKWSVHVVFPTRGSLLSSLPGEDEVDELLRKLGASLRPDPLPRDLRRCCFCHEEGDGMTDGPARLLNLDLDLWVHLNCALWSSEVYETQAGALINVELALRRGMAVHCTYCQQTGATSGCHRLRCGNAYHFTCALKAQCTFFKDKTMLCHLHRPRDRAAAPATTHHDQELRCFTVFRRVYVQRDEARQMASIVQRGERRHTFRVGSLVFHTVGQLLPQQMAAFHSANAIFPVGYRASRIYWSTRQGNHRCRYLCSVEENEGQPEFVVRMIEQGYDDLVLTGASPKGVWDKILEPVADRRNESGTLKLFPVYLKGEDLFGFTVTAVTRIVESLPGVEACDRYTFRFGRNPLMELPLAINPTGSARSEPKACSHVKRPHTLSSTGIVSSKSMQTVGSVGVVDAPEEVIPKQFASVPFQYRRMKAEWKSNVYLARSRIQGLGLYAARDIESHTMVIEYIGTLIRNEVANRMEKMYESQNRGVYMFRLDSEHVVDATITGGPARYINHSCAPNCIAEAVSLERGDKIIISSCRNIQRGEELCYDYKFDLEDDQHKIPCHCGAVNCRKWMN